MTYITVKDDDHAGTNLDKNSLLAHFHGIYVDGGTASKSQKENSVAFSPRANYTD
jgi:hypothetical protein